jgi:glycosyltransferase involved in cell wall biosynthesis
VSGTRRGRLSATVRRGLRARFGLWPMHEARNRLLLGPRTPALRRFEDAEVRRLRPLVAGRDSALVVTVMPTFRRPELLPDAVASALAQTVTDHLVIVVDDGGGLPPLTEHPRLVTVSLSRNTGVLGLVRNVGIRLTSSTFIAFLDDDNRWRPDHLSSALAALHRGADLVYTAVERHRPDGSRLDVLSKPFDRRLFADSSGWVDANSLVIRREPDVLFSRLPRVKATLPKEDWEFVYRMSRRRIVEHVPEPTVRYLVNDASYYTDWRTASSGESSGGSVKQRLQRARRLAVDAVLDRRYGVRTSGYVDLGELGVAADDRVAYAPTGWLTLRRVLPRRTVSDRDVFIDFGSGKGRVVLQAATYPFKRVIGVEVSEQLTALAKDNVERNRHRLRCQDVTLLTVDARDYAVPDDVTVAFFFNPFIGDVFATVIDRLIASVDRNPRTIRLIYVNPVEEATLLRTGRVEPTGPTTGPIRTYLIKPAH